ncbi:MAG: 7-cyano-7-deazaguanine synthase [Deltaproteobacteria bacterium]|nr:7-cyano-7-deazaguanine synthase [Deltaproteobacteria bacterium]
MHQILSKVLKPQQRGAIAILVSGGLDSSVLLAEQAAAGKKVYPVFIETGLHFEPAQKKILEKFIQKLSYKNIQPLTTLSLPLRDLYAKNHWAVSGKKVPSLKTADEAVYLPGWNLLLLTPAFVFAAQNGISKIALGHLFHNPFPDSQTSFFRKLERTAEEAFWRKIRVERPFRHLKKESVIRRGRKFPLELTMSCINPTTTKHCGACNKCEERHKYFIKAKVPDPTVYVRKMVG